MKIFFQEMVKAASDFKFYKQAKDFQRSKAIKYIFFVILSVTIAITLRYNYDVGKGLDLLIEWSKVNLPVIEINKGVASVEAKQPYKVEDEGFVLILDTTGKTLSLDGYEKGLLLMKSKVMYKESGIKSETYSLSGIESLRVDENFMKLLRKNAPWILFPIMLIILFIYFSVTKFIQVFIFSPVSLVTVSIANIKLNYNQIFNIGIYAITPSSILGVLLAVLGIHLPLVGILYVGLYVIYLIMAVLNCREDQIEQNS